MTTKKHHTKSKSKSKSKTKKCKLSKQDLQIVCTNTTHVLDSFEKDFEKRFKHSLTNENTNIEKTLVKMFKAPFTPSKYTAKNDYYTFINYQWIADKTKELEQKSKYYVHTYVPESKC